MEFFKNIIDLGFPIAAAIAAGYFVFLTLKFILAGVTNSINGLSNIIKSLDSRVEIMNNEVQKIDVRITYVVGLEPIYERISRAKHEDLRKD